MLERNGNVNIGGVSCLLKVGIGAVNMEVDAITVQELVVGYNNTDFGTL